MVKKYHPKKRVVRRKRVFHRKHKMYKGVSTVANIPRFQKFRYVDTVNINSVAGGVNSCVMAANNPNDPCSNNVTLAAHKPMRWGQVSYFYKRYMCIGSKITVKYIGQQADNQPMTAIYIWLDLDSNMTPTQGYLSNIESGRAKGVMINNVINSRPVTLSKTFSAKKWFNVKDLKDNQQTGLGAEVGADPTKLAYFILGCQAANGTSTTTFATFSICIDYVVLFSEPQDIAPTT